jgi:hypothetical protein
VSRLVNPLKSVSARFLRERNFPEVWRKPWGSRFWTPGYCARFELLRPERAELRNPRVELGEAAGAERIQPAAILAAHADKARFAQHAQVSRNPGLAHAGKGASKFAGGHFSPADAPQHLAPRRIGQRCEQIGFGCHAAAR